MTAKDATSNIPTDENIRSLIDEIEKTIPVIFTSWEKEYSASKIHKENGVGKPISAEVYYKHNPSCPEIAHELLHIKTSLILGDNSIMLDNKRFCILFDKKFCEDFINQSEHVLFYKDYLSMGYPSVEFYEQIEDSGQQYLNILERNGFRTNGKITEWSLTAFVKLCVLYLSFPIDNRFKTQKKSLKHIESTLYKVVDDYFKSLSGIHIVPTDRDKAEGLFESFANNIVAWIDSHKKSMDINNFFFVVSH